MIWGLERLQAADMLIKMLATDGEAEGYGNSGIVRDEERRKWETGRLSHVHPGSCGEPDEPGKIPENNKG